VNELGEEDPETQLSNRCLAHILIDLDERKEAGKIFSRLLEVQKRNLPEKHHLVLATRDSLNFVLTLQLKAMEAQQSSGCPAEWEIAIKHHKENLECWKETHGKRHPHTLCARNNLAGVLLHLILGAKKTLIWFVFLYFCFCLQVSEVFSQHVFEQTLNDRLPMQEEEQ